MAFKHITAQELEEMRRADAELDDEIAAQQRAYNEAHKDEIAARHRAYNEAHKDEIAAYHRAYYEAHKSKAATRPIESHK